MASRSVQWSADVHDPPLRPRSAERQRNGGGSASSSGRSGGANSVIVAERVAPLRGGGAEEARGSGDARQQQYAGHRDSRIVHRERIGSDGTARGSRNYYDQEDSDDTEYVLKSEQRLVRLKEPITGSAGSKPASASIASGRMSPAASVSSRFNPNSLPPPPLSDDVDDDDFGFALPPKPPQQQQQQQQQGSRASASPISEFYQQRWNPAAVVRDAPHSHSSFDPLERFQGASRAATATRTPLQQQQQQQQQIVFQYEPERPASRSSARSDADFSRLQHQQLSPDDLPPRPPSRNSSAGGGGGGGRVAVAPYIRAVSPVSSKSRRDSDGGRDGAAARSLTPDALAPPPVPKFAPPPAPVGRGAAIKDSRAAYDDYDDDGGLDDEDVDVRGVGLERRAVDSMHVTHDRRLKQQQQQQQQQQPQQQQQQQQQQQGGTRSPTQDRRHPIDLAPRATSVSSSSSRPSSVDRPAPLPYQLPPRHHAVAVSDADTQTPPAWADGGSVSAAAMRTQQQQQPNVLKYTGRAVPGAVIDEHHRLWTLVQALRQGISQGVNRIQTGLKIVPNDADFLFEQKERLLLPATLELPLGAAVEWKDYCPFVFRHLRQELGITSDAYLSSICSGNMNISPTAGRSGALFIVPDGGYVRLKTLTKGEGKTLRACLKAYHAHMVTNRDSLLCHIYGMYRAVTKQGTFRFVVMNNIFDTSRVIHERYDLKGSMVHRHVAANDDVRTIYKDQDFLERGRRIGLTDSARLLLKSQLNSDVRFLASQGLMDYSFLVGVHHKHMGDAVSMAAFRAPSKLPPQTQQRGFHEQQQESGGVGHALRRDDGGVQGVDPNEVFYFGIIDFLQSYNVGKKAENMFKSVISNPLEISAVEPNFFAQRFLEFVQKQLA